MATETACCPVTGLSLVCHGDSAAAAVLPFLLLLFHNNTCTHHQRELQVILPLALMQQRLLPAVLLLNPE